MTNDELFVDGLEFLPRFLQEAASSKATGGNETVVSPMDSVIVATTLRTYGILYLVLIVLFCYFRVKYPRAFNTRAWAESCQCELAKAHQHFGYLDWFWKVWAFTDDDLRDQCGMDGLSFVRIYRFGLKVAIVGMFNSVWLMPVYASAPITDENVHITDHLAMVTVGYVPSGDARLIATVLAAYIQFGAIMYFLLQEFKWFTHHRHAYLSATEPRNYTVYVSHIPEEYRSSHALVDYFRSCFSHDAVLEAHMALEIPQLEKEFGAREKLVNKLERAINVEEIKGKTPMHRSSLTGAEKVNSVQAYAEDLRELNTEIKELITEIEERNDPLSFQQDLEAEGGSLKFDPNTYSYHIEAANNGGSNSEHSSLTGDVLDHDDEISTKFNPTLPGLDEEVGELKLPPPEEAITFDTSNLKEQEDELKQSLTGSSKKGNVFSSVKSKTQDAANKAKSATAGAAAKGLSLVIKSDDGKPREAGFVTFTNLKTTQAALQQVHNETPFSFEVAEAPMPDDIFWINVGREHKSLQLGKLFSFTLTALLCIFWTIPVTFIVSLTEVESLRQRLPFLDDWVQAFPALELILAQLAPLVLILVKEALPFLLGIFSALEGPVSSSVLEASLFYKLAIFEIVQTFFVSAISGSILAEISNILNNPSAAVELLATSIPGQSAFFMQILFVQTFLGQGIELLRISPLATAWVRKYVGPRLTEKERQTTFLGIRPLSDPREFEYADVVSNGMLYFMVMFVYGPMAPVTNWFLAFCFVIMISGYRYQLVFNYPPTPDSGGQLWIGFISIAQTGMLIGQITLVGYLALKRATIAFPLMVPLVIITVLFNSYIRQRHFAVTQHLPSRAALKRDLLNQERGQMDMGFVSRAYVQPAMQDKEDVYPENYGVAREMESEQIAFMTPPGSEADIAELKEGAPPLVA